MGAASGAPTGSGNAMASDDDVDSDFGTKRNGARYVDAAADEEPGSIGRPRGRGAPMGWAGITSLAYDGKVSAP